MAIELHDGAKKAAIAYLASRLPSLRIAGRQFVDSSDLVGLMGVDDKLPSQKIAAAETEYIGSNPLFEFSIETLARDLRDQFKYELGATCLLGELDGFPKPDDYARKLVDEFCTLPWHYTYTLPLPSQFPGLLADSENELALSRDFRIARMTEERATEYPLVSSIPLRNERIGGLGLLKIGPSWQVGSECLQCQITGFVGEYGATLPMVRAASRIRALLGILLSSRALENGSRFRQSLAPPRAYFHQRLTTGWEIIRDEEISVSLGDFLHRAQLNSLNGSVAVEASRTWLRHNVLKAVPAFQDSLQAKRVQLAATWLFDAYQADALLSFVQTMVCLEILLGENGEDESIGAAIRSRCMYLIGSSYDDREEIAHTLRESYRIRSKIVHTGKDTLTHQEDVHLYSLKRICARVVSKELELLRDQMTSKTQDT